MADLRARGHLPLPYYPSFRTGDDPGERHRSGALLAALLAPLPRRAQPPGHPGGDAQLAALSTPGGTTRAVLESLLARAADQAPAWVRAAGEADLAGAQLAGTEVPLTYKTTPPPA